MSAQEFKESRESSNGDSGGTKEQVQGAAQSAASGAQEMVRQQVDQRATQVGEEVTSVAEELRGVSEHLREDNPRSAGLAGQVADKAEGLGSYLRESDADALLSDAEDLGRRQPWLVLGGGLLLGLAAARFLKASSQQRYQADRSSSNGSPDSMGRTQPEPQMPPRRAGTAAGWEAAL
jgi:hypothetical protein